MVKEWSAVFKEHCSNVIKAPQLSKLNTVSTNVNDHIGQYPPSPSSPTLKSPFKSKLLGSTMLFELNMQKLDQLYIPEAIPNDYIRNVEAFLGLQLRLTLFDTETNQFYGSTYKTSGTLDLRAVTAAVADISLEDAATKLLSRRFSVPFSDVEWEESKLLMHTSLCSPWIVALVEFVFVVDWSRLSTSGGIVNPVTARSPTNTHSPSEAGSASVLNVLLEERLDFISGGWCLFWPFNASRNGLDVAILTKAKPDRTVEELRKVQQHSQTVELLKGTPRVLTFITPLLRGAMQGYPILSPQVGASLVLSFNYVEDPFQAFTTSLMRENVFFSVEVLKDELPNASTPSLAGTNSWQVSKISLSVFPGREQFEETMLKNVAKAFYEANPELVPAEYANDFTNLPLPYIFERRLHVGLHNGFKFVAAPTTVTLSEGASELDFAGIVSLEHEMRNRCALVFALEYRLMLGVQELKLEKSKLTEIAQNLGLSQADPKLKETGIERGLLVGWGAWDTAEHDADPSADPLNRLSLSGQPGPNPFKLPVYSAPTLDTIIGEQGQTETIEQASQLILMFECSSSAAPSVPPKIPSPMPVSVPEAPVQVVVEKRDKAVSTSPPTPLPQQPELFEERAREITRPKSSLKVSALKNVDSRIERSRLSLAGFEPFYDINGKRAPLVNYRDRTLVSLNLELRDPFKVNDFRFRFMGISAWKDGAESAPVTQLWAQLPKNVYFSYQFYNTPLVITEPVHMYTGALPLKSKQVSKYQLALSECHTHGETAWPAVLYRLGDTGMPILETGNAGITSASVVDLVKDFTGVGSLVNYTSYRTRFLKYMVESDLHIDIWDADSLLHLGVCRLPLASLLRQGLPATHYQTSLDIYESSSINAAVVGRLLLDVANIGRPSTIPDAALQCAPVVPVVANFRDGLKGRSMTKVKVEHLQDTSPELRALLVDLQQAVSGSAGMFTEEASLDPKVRKFKKFQSALAKSSESGQLQPLGGGGGLVGVANEYQKRRELHHKELQTVQSYRERVKGSFVGQALLQQITSTTSVCACAGEAVYLEYVLVNPYAVDHTFTISFSDKDLRVLTDAKEWKHFRKLYGIVEGVEDKLISVGEIDPSTGCQTYQVFLYANESLAVPFVYQSLQIDCGEELCRTISVAFWNKNKHPVSMLEVHVKLEHSFPISRVFRSVVGQGDALRLQEAVQTGNRSGSSGKWLKCVGADSLATIAYSLQEQSNSPNLKHWSLKVGAEHLRENTGVPTARNNRLSICAVGFLFDDAYYSQLSETWVVVCGQLQRVDINTILGQPASTKLSKFNGEKSAQLVKCFTSNPDSVEIQPSGVFTMEPESLTEIKLLFSPSLKHAVQRTQIHIVNKATREMVGVFLLNVHPVAPTVTKSFHLQLNVGTAANKRVSYSNAYSTLRTFYLQSSRPDLLVFREPVLKLQPRQTAFIHMKFLPVESPNSAQIYVFINDSNDELEECLLIQSTYN